MGKSLQQMTIAFVDLLSMSDIEGAPGRAVDRAMVRSGDPAGSVRSVRSVQLARSGRSGQAPSAQIWPGPARAEPQQPARPGSVGLNINFTKNMYLEHKHLKFSYPGLLCGVVGSRWVLLGTSVGFWESLIDFDKNSRIQVFIRSSWAS